MGMKLHAAHCPTTCYVSHIQGACGLVYSVTPGSRGLDLVAWVHYSVNKKRI